MARQVITEVFIDSTLLFMPTGDVRAWVVKTNREVKSAVYALAPPGRSHRKWVRPRTGNLRRSVASKMDVPGRRTATGRVTVGGPTAPYAKYVLGGTAHQGIGFIYSHEGRNHKGEIDRYATRAGRRPKLPPSWFMRLPPGPGSRHQLRVHGQRSNPFLTDGYNEVARAHQALKPLRSAFRFV